MTVSNTAVHIHPRISLRTPVLADGKAVHELIRSCPPLDLNSSYNYFLLCSHFSATCVVAELDGELIGFLSAYHLPQAPDRLFIWQVAVDERARGEGLAGHMLASLLQRASCAGVHYLETTVSPSNQASRQVFSRFAARHGLGWQEETFLSREHFGTESHEEEVMFRLGPLNHQLLNRQLQENT